MRVNITLDEQEASVTSIWSELDEEIFWCFIFGPSDVAKQRLGAKSSE